MTTYITGYSPTPKNYDDYQAEQARKHDVIFGRRYSDLDLSAPQGTVDTAAYASAEKLWAGSNGTSNPKPLEFPTIEEHEGRWIDKSVLEDWRHQALPRTTVGPTFAVRADGGKMDWSLMPWEAVEEINKVLEFGSKKYSSQNWRNGSGFSWTRVLSSLLRHTFAWARGEDLDKESGLSHLAHMGCNVIFLIYYNKHKDRYNNDDREVL